MQHLQIIVGKNVFRCNVCRVGNVPGLLVEL